MYVHFQVQKNPQKPNDCNRARYFPTSSQPCHNYDCNDHMPPSVPNSTSSMYAVSLVPRPSWGGGEAPLEGLGTRLVCCVMLHM